MKKRIKNAAMDNKGVTLIELLVSVAILALVILPFLSSFISSAELNTKAKKKQRATMLAENIVEKIKADDIASIEKWSEITSNLSVDNKRNLQMENYFWMGKRYNISLTIDPTDSRYKTGISDDLINDHEFSKITEVNSKGAAIIAQGEEDENAVDTFYNSSIVAKADKPEREAFADKDEVRGLIKKSMRIMILPSTKIDYTIVEAVIVYTCRSDKLYVEEQVIENEIYSKEVRDFETMFLFYNPLDQSNTDAIHQDNLYLNNKAKKVANVYIVRKGEDTAPSGYQLDASFLMENGKQTRGIIDYRKDGEPCLTFYTNLSQAFLGNVNLHKGTSQNTLVPKTGHKPDRIYNVIVSVYPSGEWSNPLVEFTTTKEEW